MRRVGACWLGALMLSGVGVAACAIDSRPLLTASDPDAGAIRTNAGGTSGMGGSNAVGDGGGSGGASGAGNPLSSPEDCPLPGGCPVECNGCRIDGVCVTSGAPRPGNACQVCDPARDAGAWSNTAGGECDDGLFCTTGDVCAGGVCSGTPLDCEDGVACNGASVCVEAEARCAPGVNQCADGTLCDLATDTCTTTCAGCLIDGVCLPNGTALAGNPCSVCDTTRSTTGYSPTASGTLCGVGPSECSQQDTCDGAGNCQPNHLPTTARCGTLPDSCVNPDRCNGAGACQSQAAERVEACDGVDNNCDGTNNEGFDLNGDPENCGQCGHSCLGGACNAGVCQLHILADLGERQFFVRAVGDFVYSSDAGSFNRSIHRIRRDGSLVEQGVGLALGGLGAFDEDGAFFYIWRDFSDEIFLTKCDPATQGANCANGLEAVQMPMTLDRTTGLSTVAVDRTGHRVFWYNIDDDVTYASPTGAFNRTPLIGNFALGNFIYANDALWGQSEADATVVLRVPATGDFPSTVAIEAGAATFVANGTRVYWIAGDHISFVDMPFGNGEAPPNAFVGPVSPEGLAVDDQNVYWAERISTGMVVKRCPVAGCPAGGPVTITAPIIEALGLAVDDRAVYIAAGTATRVGGDEIAGGVLLIAK